MNARQRRKVRRAVEREFVALGLRAPCPDCDDRDALSEAEGYFPGPCGTCDSTELLDVTPALDWLDVLDYLGEEREGLRERRRWQLRLQRTTVCRNCGGSGMEASAPDYACTRCDDGRTPKLTRQERRRQNREGLPGRAGRLSHMRALQRAHRAGQP